MLVGKFIEFSVGDQNESGLDVGIAFLTPERYHSNTERNKSLIFLCAQP